MIRDCTFYVRYRWLIFLFYLAATPLVVVGAMQGLASNTNRLNDWLPSHFDESERLEWFRDHFGSDDMIMVTWPHCDVDDPRLPIFTERLRQSDRLPNGESVRWFDRVIPGNEAVTSMTESQARFSNRQAKVRLRGFLIGPDGRSTGIVLTTTAQAWHNRTLCIQWIRKQADSVPGLKAEALRITGGIAETIAVDRASQASVIRMSLFSYGISLVILLVLFRSWIIALCIFLNALFAQQLPLALVYYTGGHVDSVMLLAPSLVYVLTVSAGVHLVNYCRETIPEKGNRARVAQGIRHALGPCAFAAITTAIGMLSLRTSQLSPVKNFAVVAAIGVLVGTLSLFMLLPTQLLTFTSALPSKSTNVFPPKGYSDRIYRWRTPLVFGALIIGLVSLLGVWRLQGTTQIGHMFPRGAQIIRDYQWTERHIGPQAPLEMVVCFPPSEDPNEPLIEQLRGISSIQKKLHSFENIHSVLSLVNLVPLPPRGPSISAVVRRESISSHLVSFFDDPTRWNLVRRVQSRNLWRLSMRLHAVGQEIDYEDLIGRLTATVTETLSPQGPNKDRPVQTVICGGLPLLQKSQQQLLIDLRRSFVVAFMFTAIAMMIPIYLSDTQHSGFANGFHLVPRRIIAGVVLMAPNVLPCLGIFGVLGFIDYPVDIGVMLTASVALGIAVDNTLHLVTWYRASVLSGQPISMAIHESLSRCGAAVIQTALVCGLGMLAFAPSVFGPIARFGWMMSCILIAAMFADLIFLPAIFATKLGHWLVTSPIDPSDSPSVV